MLLIKNAKIITCRGDYIENGYILTENNKIKKIGAAESLAAISCDNTLDAGGRYVTPGLIDGHCHAGLWQNGISADENDGNESTDALTPNVFASDAVNPCDRAFSDALAAGITTVVTGPGSANVIGGAFCAMKTYGSCADDMIFKNPVAMKFAFGENPKHSHGKKTVATRMAAAAAIRDIFEKTKIYINKKSAGDFEYNSKLEALIPVLEGALPVKAHAHSANDIFTALRIAKEYNLKMTIEHASDGALIADRLAKENFGGVLAGPLSTTRLKSELRGFDMSLAAKLNRAGIKTAIITDFPEEPFEYLAVNASLMQRYGIERDEALKMITRYPAELCGIADRVGTLEEGKDADIAVWSAHPLEVMATAQAVIVNGKIVYGGM